MKTNLKTISLIAVTLLSMISFSSCKDDDWEPLKWTIDNMNPENIVVKTHPEHEAYESEKFIIANAEGGEIIFYCENYDDLYLVRNSNNIFDNNIISVKVVGDKVIINFPKLDELPEETSWTILEIKTKKNKNSGTVFWIGRDSDLNF